MSSGWEIEISCEIELSGDILVVVRLNSLLPKTFPPNASLLHHHVNQVLPGDLTTIRGFV
jgi:hypothetical protein